MFGQRWALQLLVRLIAARTGSAAPAIAPEPHTGQRSVERVSVRGGKPRVRVTPGVLAAISSTVGVLPAESGGFLGITDGVVDRFRFDQRSATTSATYAPDVAAANEERLVWERQGSRFAGFVHSHPGCFAQPSFPDREYAQRILSNAKVDELLLPIVLPSAGSMPQIEWYLARATAEGVADVERVGVDIVTSPLEEQFARVAGAYDVAWLERCRIIAIGCGGAREALENFARIGVAQFVLVDPDIVTPSNLATQAVRRIEIGRPKVLAAADAIHEVNPDAAVVALQCSIEDIERPQLDMLVRGAWAGAGPPARSLVGLWSDSPSANAYAHRVALHHGVPAVSASLHRGGASGEVVLSYPGRTPGCIRCATRNRYAHYLAGGVNDATSSRVPFWTTPRLNALKVCVVAAALHSVDGLPFGASVERRDQTALLDRIAQRPFALLRLAPNAGEISGLRIHEHVLAGCNRPTSVIFDETVWREVDVDPQCPDCCGLGDLRRVIGRIADFDALPARKETA